MLLLRTNARRAENTSTRGWVTPCGMISESRSVPAQGTDCSTENTFDTLKNVEQLQKWVVTTSVDVERNLEADAPTSGVELV